MAEGLGALDFLGRLLSLPADLPLANQQREQQELANKALLGMAASPTGDMPPETAQAVNSAMLQPEPKPYLGKVGGALGTIGHILSSVAGGGQTAPRVPPEYMEFLRERRAERDKLRVEDRLERFHKDTIAHEEQQQANFQQSEDRRDRAEDFREREAGARDANMNRRLDLMEQGIEGKFPNDTELAAIAAGVRQHPGISPQQAQATLDKKNETAGQRAATVETAKTPALEERAKKLQAIKDLADTSTTKTMRQRAPTVVYQANKVMRLLDIVRTGPLVGRFKEMMTTDAGFEDTDYRKLRTDLGLLISAVTQMHVGSRAVEGIGKEFVRTIGHTSQDANNLRASLGEVIDYANHIINRPTGSAAGTGTAGAPAAPDAGGGSLREQHPEFFNH